LTQKLEMLEKEAEQNLFFLRTATVWNTLPKPTENEYPPRRMEILEREKKQKYKKQTLQLQEIKSTLAGVEAQISAIENE
jgi:hypothetical protein